MKVITFVENTIYTALMFTVFAAWLVGMLTMLLHGNLAVFAVVHKFGFSASNISIFIVMNCLNGFLMYLYYRVTEEWL